MIKKITLLNIVLLLGFILNAQTTAIPDDIFEDYLETHDANGNFVGFGSPFSMGDGFEENGLVLTSRISNVTNLSISDLNIQDLTGLEDFISLVSFTMNNNIAPNLVLNFNINPNIQDITILGAPNLISLQVSQVNNLQNLLLAAGNFSQTNPSLSFDFSSNTNLESIFIRTAKVESVTFGENNFNLESVDLSLNQLKYLDVSDLTNLVSLDASGNELLSTNIKNGNNAIITNIDLDSNPNLTCVLVDDISFAELQVDWMIDTNANYIDFYDPVSFFEEASSQFVSDDGQGNAFDVASWFNANGGAAVNNPNDPCGDLVWTYSYHIIEEPNENGLDIFYDTTFIVVDAFGNTQSTNASFVIEGIKHFEEDIYGTGDTICDDKYDLNTIVTDIQPSANLKGSNITSLLFEQINNFESNQGPLGATFEDTDVDFPDTSAGSFSYLFKVSIEKSVPIYKPDTDSIDFTSIEEEANITINDKTVAFEVSGPNSIADCNNSINSIEDLTDLLIINPDPEIFIPQNPIDLNQYWTPSTFTGPGTYTYDPTPAFPNCPTNSVTVVVTQYNASEMLPITNSNFENYLINEGIDSNPVPDNQIMASDVCSTTSIDIVSLDIEDFTDLQYFKNLTSFRLINNQASVISGLDFSENKELLSIEIINTPQVASIDISQNIKLEELTVVTNGNLFNAVNVSSNTNLTLLQLANNQISNIDLTNNPTIEFLSVANNPITAIDVSILPGLKFFDTYESLIEIIDVSNNTLLESLNSDNGNLKGVKMNNGNNSILTNLELNNNPNLSCIIVDDVTFAESQSTWLKDLSASYVVEEDVLNVSLFPTGLTINYDAAGNDLEIDTWLANITSNDIISCSEVNIEYNIISTEIDLEFGESLFCTIEGTVTDVFGNEQTFETSVVYEDFPVAGPTDQGDGVVCDKSTNLNGINGVDFFASKYANSTKTLSGPGSINQDTFDVDFPDTSAGSFSYSYSISVVTPLRIGTLEFDFEDSAGWLFPNVTRAFDPGDDKVLTVCENDVVTLMDLYDQFIIEDDVSGDDALNFNPNDYWFNESDNAITSYNGPGVYTFNAQAFFPDCGGVPATVTVIEDAQLSAGTNGTLEIPSGSTVNEIQLFGALQGSPDPGGTWSPTLAGAGIYTYTHDNGLCDSTSAQVEVTEDTLSVIEPEQTLNALKLFPNPAKDQINLIGNIAMIDSITLYGVNGQMLLTKFENLEQIDISDLGIGMYFIEVQRESKVRVMKFFKH